VARLFHALVVCGASLTLTQCGGRAEGDDDASGGTGPNTGGGPGSGGMAVPGTGGWPGTGGVMPGTGGLGTGAAAASGGTPSYGGVGGATTEWTGQSNCPAYYCDQVQVEGRWASAISLFEPCPIERGRPASAADCAPGQRFSCVLGVASGTARLVNCECIAVSDGCVCPGPSANGCVDYQSDTCTDQANICGCARTCILIR
jgi:hypothetical protein